MTPNNTPTEVPLGHPLYQGIISEKCEIKLLEPILCLPTPVPIHRILGPARFEVRDGRTFTQGWWVQVMIDQTAWFAELF